MKIIPFYYDDYDDLFANTYILIDKNNNCVVIDPSKDNDGISNYIKKNQLSLKGVLLTHGHFDHIRGVKRLIDEFNVPFYIGFEEVAFLTDTYLNCSMMMSNPYIINDEPITISDNEILHLLDEEILCIHTPFHTIGSYCFYLKNSEFLFSGDFIFKGSIGRWDLPTGNHKYIKSSLSKIFALPDEVKIYPGHGNSTTVLIEKSDNPFY